MLYGEIFKHRFDHQIGACESAVVGGAAKLREHVVHLQTRDLLAFETFAQHVAHRAPAGV